MAKSKSFNRNRLMKSNWEKAGFLLLICIPILFACSHTEKVLIPPRVDLKTYKAIGVINFSATEKKDLEEYVTQKYIQTVQSAQPGVRFLELGSKKHVLTRISHRELDLDAIKSIGREYNVDALIFGNFATTDPKPNLRLSSSWQSLKAGALVEASLITRIWETDSGVVLWTNSTARKKKVAGLYADANGNIKFGASDPEQAYGQLVPEMVYANTTDFRSRYEYRKVK
jgi:hypothetical protein